MASELLANYSKRLPFEPMSTIFVPVIVVMSLAAIEYTVAVEALSTISLVTIAITTVVIAAPVSAACIRATDSAECNWTCMQARDCPLPSTSAGPMSIDSDICWNTHSPSSLD